MPDKKPAVEEAELTAAKTIKFTESVKHASPPPKDEPTASMPLFQFFKGQVVGFEDLDAADYFIRCGWAEASTAEPSAIISKAELDIDPETVLNATGLRVQDIVVESLGG